MCVRDSGVGMHCNMVWVFFGGLFGWCSIELGVGAMGMVFFFFFPSVWRRCSIVKEVAEGWV